MIMIAAMMLLLCISGKQTYAASGNWVTESGSVRYQLKSGKYVTGKFREIGGKWFCFDADGNVRTGWFDHEGKHFYGSRSKKAGKTGALYGGWQKLGGNIYFFSRTGKAGSYGAVSVGWKKIRGNIYYFDNTGKLQTGWQTIGGTDFYFAPTGKAGRIGRLQTGWQTIGGKKYYLRTEGKMGVIGSRYTSEWVTIDNARYYFNVDGTYNTRNWTESYFIRKIGKLARKDMKKTGILASVTVAQAILESGYGTSSLGMEAHNLFGMKAMLSNNSWKSAWKGDTFVKKTMEYLGGKWYTITDTFRAYDTFEESIADHSAYLSYAKNGKRLRYAGVVGNKNYEKTIKIIKAGGYATAPTYVTRICEIIKQYNLTKYDK